MPQYYPQRITRHGMVHLFSRSPIILFQPPHLFLLIVALIQGLVLTRFLTRFVRWWCEHICAHFTAIFRFVLMYKTPRTFSVPREILDIELLHTFTYFCNLSHSLQTFHFMHSVPPTRRVQPESAAFSDYSGSSLIELTVRLNQISKLLVLSIIQMLQKNKIKK